MNSTTPKAMVTRESVAALSVRRVANEGGTTTRAVYNLFGSKDGLVVALGVRVFDLLGETIAVLPRIPDPMADLVQAGLAFRHFALDHPVFFRIGVQLIDVPGESARRFANAAYRALAVLHDRVGRLGDIGSLCHKYIGQPYPVWTDRVVFLVEPEHAYAEAFG